MPQQEKEGGTGKGRAVYGWEWQRGGAKKDLRQRNPAGSKFFLIFCNVLFDRRKGWHSSPWRGRKRIMRRLT